MTSTAAPVATGRLAELDYCPPDSPAEVVLDVVTPTRGRKAELIAQAERLGPQLLPQDRWIIVDDASKDGHVDLRALLHHLPNVDCLFFMALSYRKPSIMPGSTVNRARHIACSVARPEAWIVEVDDHDMVTPQCLDLIRAAICRGATFLYGDCVSCYPDGQPMPGSHYVKPEYRPWLLRDEMCPGEGVRAFPKFLYDAVGGYRWYGDREPGGNEFPAGDYGLFMRIEEFCEGQGFARIPEILCTTVKDAWGITGQHGTQQSEMAHKLRNAALSGGLLRL